MFSFACRWYNDRDEGEVKKAKVDIRYEKQKVFERTTVGVVPMQKGHITPQGCPERTEPITVRG